MTTPNPNTPTTTMLGVRSTECTETLSELNAALTVAHVLLMLTDSQEVKREVKTLLTTKTLKALRTLTDT
jgi:hypothetical protein